MSTRELVGDVGRLGGDGQGGQDLVDHAALLEDLLGLALEDDRHVDGDLLVAADQQEVDVGDGVADRVALQLLHDAELATAPSTSRSIRALRPASVVSAWRSVPPVDVDGDRVGSRP